MSANVIKYPTKQNQKLKTSSNKIFPIKVSKYLVFLQKNNSS